jgi:predicted pyridoxine 5'-phosphate oxidase superfamily flavin-nucleotide-binding protein
MNTFTEIAFTDGVKAAQYRYGSREIYKRLESGRKETARLTRREMDFIGARDSFYLATVSETGWPYVQHRGGEAGFVKIINDCTIGFSDYRGNRQYLTVGHLATNPKVALILMDYGKRRRLKIWGIATIIENGASADFTAALRTPDSDARMERALVITVAAYDWNCSQYITPRYTSAEWDDLSRSTADSKNSLAPS